MTKSEIIARPKATAQSIEDDGEDVGTERIYTRDYDIYWLENLDAVIEALEACIDE